MGDEEVVEEEMIMVMVAERVGVGLWSRRSLLISIDR